MTRGVEPAGFSPRAQGQAADEIQVTRKLLAAGDTVIDEVIIRHTVQDRARVSAPV
jgi:hypothetical protein